MKFDYLLTILFSCFCLFCFGQSTNLFDKIQQIGIVYTKPLKEGNIESMKKIEPPKNTWTYLKLLEYKDAISKDSGTIKYGSFIQPGIKKDVYSFNFFALDYKKIDKPYYFVAVVSFRINNNEPSVDNAFLFTEERPLGDWWMRAVSFYKDRDEGKLKNNIPEKYIFSVCPPPPYDYSEK